MFFFVHRIHRRKEYRLSFAHFFFSQYRRPRQRSNSRFFPDRVHQRFQEQNLETPRYFQRKSDVGLVAPFTVMNEAFGRTHTFSTSRCSCCFPLGIWTLLQRALHMAVRWWVGTGFTAKCFIFRTPSSCALSPSGPDAGSTSQVSGHCIQGLCQ